MTLSTPLSAPLRLAPTQPPTPGAAMLIHTQPVASSSSKPIEAASPVGTLSLSGGRVKKFVCTVEGCGKAYTRPVRLEEHVRTHTGEVSRASNVWDGRGEEEGPGAAGMGVAAADEVVRLGRWLRAHGMLGKLVG